MVSGPRWAMRSAVDETSKKLWAAATRKWVRPRRRVSLLSASRIWKLLASFKAQSPRLQEELAIAPVGPAKSSSELPEDLESDVRVVLDRRPEVVLVKDEKAGVDFRRRRRGARQIVDDRHLRSEERRVGK